MSFCPNSADFSKKMLADSVDSDIKHMAVRILCRLLDFDQNLYCRAASRLKFEITHILLCVELASESTHQFHQFR